MAKNIRYYNSRLRTYYETIYVVAAKNLKVRYKKSILGFFWTLINPLFMLSIFIFILGKVIRGIDNYPLFVLSGLLFWNFFTSSSNQIINKIQESSSILKSINVPPIIFPLASLAANLVNFLLTFLVFMVLMVVLGYTPSFNLLLIIPALLMFVVFTFGISLALASMNVYFKDVEMFWTTITPALMYATPVVYMTPDSLRKYMVYNPFSHFMELFRDILYYDRFPSLEHLLFPFALSTAALLIGLFVYQKLRKGFISNF